MINWWTLIIISGVHHIKATDGQGFGAYVFGSTANGCAYAFPAGMCIGAPVSYIIYIIILT